MNRTKKRIRICPVCGKEYTSSFPYCSPACRQLHIQSSRDDKKDWYELQLEVARPLAGRIVRGGRPGRYSDVETPYHLAECKLTERDEQRIDAFWVLKTQKLAERTRKFPVLVLAVGGLAGHRVAFFLDDGPRDTSKSVELFAPVLNQWLIDGRQVWVAGFTAEALTILKGEPESIPGLGSLRGVRYTMDWAKTKESLTKEFDALKQEQNALLQRTEAIGQRLLQLQGKFEMAEQSEAAEKAEADTANRDEPAPDPDGGF